MFRNKNYSPFLKLFLVLFIFICILLFVNIWLYYEPSALELTLSRWLQFNRPDWLTVIMKIVSDSYIAIAIIVGGVCIWSLANRKYATAFVLAFSLASLLLIDSIKMLFQRPRPLPETPTIEFIAGTSFPSGHVYTATVLAGTLFLLYIVSFNGHRPRTGLVLMVGYILLMAWSRIYLQVHYPSDVVGGAVFGIFTIAILGLLYRWLRR